MSAREDFEALVPLADSSVPFLAPLVTVWAARAALDEIDRLRAVADVLLAWHTGQGGARELHDAADTLLAERMEAL